MLPVALIIIYTSNYQRSIQRPPGVSRAKQIPKLHYKNNNQGLVVTWMEATISEDECYRFGRWKPLVVSPSSLDGSNNKGAAGVEFHQNNRLCSNILYCFHRPLPRRLWSRVDGYVPFSAIVIVTASLAIAMYVAALCLRRRLILFYVCIRLHKIITFIRL